MTLRKIATIGHPVLRTPARAVTPEEIATPAFQQFVDDLIETMRDANGAGIAANQVFEPVRVCVLEVRAGNPRYPYKPAIPLTVLVNPVIAPLSEERFDNYEGCLSVPNLRGRVSRFAEVRVTALDRHGQPVERVARGLSAGTYQHEVDHLDGTLFVDRVTDPHSFSTWSDFERFHLETFSAYARQIVDRYGG